ncbi:MAG: tetraacyldisaccharide 4'-kinase [Bacteriovoracia bacterium]
MIGKVRSWFYQNEFVKPVRLPGFVVSVGNISLGGTGKSPFVMLLAERALAAGLRTAVLSRGYKRKSGELVIVGSQEKLPSVDLLGDEPWMIKNRLPGISLLVHPDRGRMAEKNWQKLGAPELVILDDGFQHWKLARDRDVVMVDGEESIFGRTLPFGRMREPAEALGRADLVAITRSEALVSQERKVLAAAVTANMENRLPALWKRSGAKRPDLVWAAYEFREFADFITGEGVLSTEGKAFVLVSGIAKPAGLRAMALSLGLAVKEEIQFPDHHRLEAADLKKIQIALQKNSGAVLLLSEKDAARWKEDLAGTSGLVLKVRLRFSEADEAKIQRFLAEIFAEARRCSISG